MAKIHNIEQSLKKEVQGQPRNDRFYTEVKHATNIRRVGYDTPEEQELQRQDIDLFATIDGQQVSISEKDRARDYNDLLVEFYSVYPTTRGWMDTSQAQFMAYFFRTRVFWINKIQLVDFYNNVLRHLPVEQHFDELIRTGRPKKSATFVINNNNETVDIISADNGTYYTMSISIDFALLTRAGIEFTEYPL